MAGHDTINRGHRRRQRSGDRTSSRRLVGEHHELWYTPPVFAAKPAFALRPRTVETVTTPFNTMSVVVTGARVDLDVAGATYATWHPQALMTGYSWDGLSVGAMLVPTGKPRSVLLLGLGGGTVARQLLAFSPDVQITGVEIDPGVVDIAQRHLHLDPRVRVVVQDAYDYLHASNERFDVVIDDLFLTGTEDVVRSRVPEGDTLSLLRAHTAPGGVVLCNLITDEGEHKDVRRRARRAFRDAFAEARVVRPPRGLNEILVGGDAVSGQSALSPLGSGLSKSDRELLDAIKVKRLAK